MLWVHSKETLLKTKESETKETIAKLRNTIKDKETEIFNLNFTLQNIFH